MSKWVARRPRRPRIVLLFILLAVALIRNQDRIRSWVFPPNPRSQLEDATGGGREHSSAALPSPEEAWEGRRSGVLVAAQGEVIRPLSDDREGSRHQRFLIRLDSGQTLLVVHNIDLAPRVPVEVGDRISLQGEYEWNDQGGLVHWTHHDPAGRHPGGWIRHEGQTYR